MSGLSRWRARYTLVDAEWWRDWVFWVAIALSVVNLVVTLVVADRPWWDHLYRFGLAMFWVTLILGCGRQLVRGFREPRPSDDGDPSP